MSKPFSGCPLIPKRENENMKIEKDKIVHIDYVMQVTSEEESPAEGEASHTGFLFGHEHMMPAIEQALSGKEEGDEVQVRLAPGEAFGERRHELVETIEKDKFSKEISFVEGSEFEVPGVDGHPETILVKKVTDTHVTLDRNHPMAGKAISCEITVREVRDASKLEIEHEQPMEDDSHCGCSGH